MSGQLGQERTPEEYVANMVQVFREVKRVLRPDGTLWLNLGDSYAANRSYQVPSTKGGAKHSPAQSKQTSNSVPVGLKPKDLIGIPWRVAFALQAEGWYLRSDIIWTKPNPMPESVTDRPTKAHEYIFLLTKSERYYFDSKAIAEPVTESTVNRVAISQPRFGGSKYGDSDDPAHRTKSGNKYNGDGGLRNSRTVWSIATKPYKGSHFATFPEAIPEKCIRAGSRIGDLILDPFGGTATTGLVAERLNRKWVCMDLGYFELSQKRTNLVQHELIAV